MARLRIKDSFCLSVPALNNQKLYTRDPETEEVTDDFAVSTTSLLSVPPNTTLEVDTSVFTDVRFIYVETDIPAAINITATTASDAWVALQPYLWAPNLGMAPGATIPGRLKLFTTGVTVIKIKNPNADVLSPAANVLLVLGGINTPVI